MFRLPTLLPKFPAVLSAVRNSGPGLHHQDARMKIYPCSGVLIWN